MFDRNFKHVFEVFDIRINNGLMCLQDWIMGQMCLMKRFSHGFDMS